MDKQILELKNQVDDCLYKIKLEDKSKELEELKQKSQDPDFWKDNISAQKVMVRISQLEESIKPWSNIKKDLEDLVELSKLEDSSLQEDIDTQIQQLKERFNKLKKDLKYSGPYDDHNAIMSIYAGAGGTDAQDWTQMLFRMYSRWAEKNNYKLTVIEESPGEEAGLKSVTAEISGKLAYGKLKNEQGVHRLVRLSPFNSDNLRQTSFAKVELLPKIDQPEELDIDDKDLKIDVFRSGGHGGQSVNTTDSAVRVTHIPTGITVSIQNERSQLQNKETAMTVIRSKLMSLKLAQHKDKISELKGPNQSAEWGNQIRNYVLHPYKLVKDLRTKVESKDPESVLNGDIELFLE
jgi:peptide chain release factor 2